MVTGAPAMAMLESGSSPAPPEADVGYPALLVRARACVFAVPLRYVLETMRPLPVEPLPDVPQFVKGLAVIRGAPVPVVDLGALLGGAASTETRRFVTLRLRDRCVALAVTAVLDVRELDLSTLLSAPPLVGAAGQDLVEALGTLDGELLLVLRATRLLPEKVWEALSPEAATPEGARP